MFNSFETHSDSISLRVDPTYLSYLMKLIVFRNYLLTQLSPVLGVWEVNFQ